ncbi:hypothetical protein PI124_g15487 [Phytophthora idaei]|nr:hypothetical protein PI125_g16927 [Phytophthora idaei]KAG3239587.1 hypothetical protein PI124_g15487 [Phytophthora idaei]
MKTQVEAVETPDEAMTTLAEDEATGCLLQLLLVSSAQARRWSRSKTTTTGLRSIPFQHRPRREDAARVMETKIEAVMTQLGAAGALVEAVGTLVQAVATLPEAKA